MFCYEYCHLWLFVIEATAFIIMFLYELVRKVITNVLFHIFIAFIAYWLYCPLLFEMSSLVESPCSLQQHVFFIRRYLRTIVWFLSRIFTVLTFERSIDVLPYGRSIWLFNRIELIGPLFPLCTLNGSMLHLSCCRFPQYFVKKPFMI